MEAIYVILIIIGIIVFIWLTYALLRFFLCTSCKSQNSQNSQKSVQDIKNTTINNNSNSSDTPLNDATTDQSLTKPSNSVILFYAPWCGFCKRFIPEWNKFVKENKSRFSPIAVNGDNFSQHLKRYGVSGFPTVVLETTDGKTASYKNKEMTADAIESWIKSV
jgi:thiol-disulfide isomerase/thioredoxin